VCAKVLEFVWGRCVNFVCAKVLEFVWGRCVNFVCAKVLEFMCAKVLNLCVPRCSNLCVPRCSIYVGVDAARLCGLLGRRNWAGAGGQCLGQCGVQLAKASWVLIGVYLRFTYLRTLWP
jgi:hypothetical protein